MCVSILKWMPMCVQESIRKLLRFIYVKVQTQTRIDTQKRTHIHIVLNIHTGLSPCQVVRCLSGSLWNVELFINTFRQSHFCGPPEGINHPFQLWRLTQCLQGKPTVNKEDSTLVPCTVNEHRDISVYTLQMCAITFAFDFVTRFLREQASRPQGALGSGLRLHEISCSFLSNLQTGSDTSSRQRWQNSPSRETCTVHVLCRVSGGRLVTLAN